MVRFSFRFPHISRFLPATLFFVLLWGSFGLLIAINSLQKLPGTPATPKVDINVLGAQSDLAFWKSVIEEKPDYRDAYVAAAAAAYKMENYEEARELINRAFTIDPTSPTVQKLKAIMED